MKTIIVLLLAFALILLLFISFLPKIRKRIERKKRKREVMKIINNSAPTKEKGGKIAFRYFESEDIIVIDSVDYIGEMDRILSEIKMKPYVVFWDIPDHLKNDEQYPKFYAFFVCPTEARLIIKKIETLDG